MQLRGPYMYVTLLVASRLKLCIYVPMLDSHVLLNEANQPLPSILVHQILGRAGLEQPSIKKFLSFQKKSKSVRFK